MRSTRDPLLQKPRATAKLPRLCLLPTPGVSKNPAAECAAIAKAISLSAAFLSIFERKKKRYLRGHLQTAMTRLYRRSCIYVVGMVSCIYVTRPIPTTFRQSLEGNTQRPCWTKRSTPSHKLTILIIVFYMHRSALCVCAAVVIGDAVCFSIGSTLPQLRRSTSRYLSNACLVALNVHLLCLCAGLCSVRGLCMCVICRGY